mgnify:CR=1 FL=1
MCYAQQLPASWPTVGVAWKFGYASTNFEHVQGPAVFFGGNQNSGDVYDWLTAQWNGTGQVTSTSTATSYQLFSRKREEIECKSSTMPLRSLDLEFRDAAGLVVQPTSGLLELEISE